MTLLRVSGMLLLPFLLSSCAVMTADECRQANWYEVGQRDGRAGETLAKFTERREACAEARVVVDANAYAQGRDLGLRAYCRLDNAVQIGLDGGTYHGVCPAVMDYEFRRRVEVGHDVYYWRGQVSTYESRINNHEKRMREADRNEDKELKIATNDEQRRNIRREFDNKRQRLRDELREADRELHHARERLRDAERAMYSLR